MILGWTRKPGWYLKLTKKTILIEHKRSIFPQKNKLKVRKNLKQKLREVSVWLLSSNLFCMNYA